MKIRRTKNIGNLKYWKIKRKFEKKKKTVKKFKNP
jgi:hypothetical protein